MDTHDLREGHEGGAVKAGRELDKRVSVEYLNEPFDPNASYPWDGIQPYSTNIVAAWQIWLGLIQKRPSWMLGIWGGKPTVFRRRLEFVDVVAQGGTFEEAICLAALRFAAEVCV